MERFLIQARPQPYDVIPYRITLNPPKQSDLNVAVIGRSFLNIRNVYLSGLVIDPDLSSYFNPFSAVWNLSANNSGFYGLSVYFNLNDRNYLTFQIPENIFITSGYFDVILENEAGFGILSQDSRVPFISSWSGAEDFQRPCVSGIYINFV